MARVEDMEFFGIADSVQMAISLITDDPYYSKYWVSLTVAAICFATLFALEAAALFIIAGKNGYKNRWMAFVPFFNTYYIGVLAAKNKTFKKDTKYFALAMAIAEVVKTAIGVLSIVAVFQIFSPYNVEMGYISAKYEPYLGGDYLIFQGNYNVSNFPENLNWALWVFNYISDISYAVDLIYIVLAVFVLSAFFRSYSPKNYLAFTILSVILPIKSIFMIAVRDNKETDYADYVRDIQRRRYNAYQEYMRNNANQPPFNGYGGYNGYNGNNAAPHNQEKTPPEDPFGGLGENVGGDNGQGEDPFGDLK